MNSIKNIERLQRLHAFIEGEQTGSPKEIAKKMKVSERLVFNLMEQLKDFGALINYDRKRKTYYYFDKFELHIEISVSIFSGDSQTKIYNMGRS